MQKQKGGVKGQEDKILVTIYQNNFPLHIFGQGSKSFFVPSNANVHYLRTFITGRFSNSKDSIFLFAYGNILNNNETMQSLSKKYQSKITPKTGMEIQIASMASF